MTVVADSAYRELAALVLADQPLTATLSRVAELTRDALPGVDDVSVTLVQGGKARSVAFAGDSRLAALLDERQYEDGFGPCLDAAVSGDVVEIADTSVEHDIYPDFAALAHRLGVRHTMSVGLPTLQEVTGGLNLYGHVGTEPFSPEVKEAAAGFASYVGVALTNSALYHGAVELAQQMQEAMASRAVIEQAKGILMRAQGIDEDEAFALLRRQSSHTNRKLRDVARGIVDSVCRR